MENKKLNQFLMDLRNLLDSYDMMIQMDSELDYDFGIEISRVTFINRYETLRSFEIGDTVLSSDVITNILIESNE